MQDISLSTVDLVIVVLYFLVVFAIGFRMARRTHSAEDLFLAGRRLGWLPIGLSLFASNISSTTMIGLTGAAYTWGIAVANYEWMAAPILVVFALFLVPLYLNARIGTVPEFLEYRYDRHVRRYFSLLTIVANIVVDTAGTLFAGAIVLTVFMPGLDLFTAALLLAVIAGLYTAAGGLAAVVYTDVLQAVILLAGSSVVAVLAFAQLDFSWAQLVAQTPPSHLSLMLPLADENLPWLGTLVGVPILGFYFWCTNQFIVQRVLGARSIAHARRGALFAGLLKLPVLFLMVLPGVMASVFMPGLEQGDQVFPALISTLLPPGLAGLVLAALVAALMSSIDSTLNSAAALVTLDFVKPMWPQLDAAPDGLDRTHRHRGVYAVVCAGRATHRRLRGPVPLPADRAGVPGAAGGGDLSVWTVLATCGCGRRAGNIAGRTRRLGAVFCRHVDGLAGVALHPDRGPDLCCQQRAVLGDREANGATITAAGCPVHLPAGDPGAHRTGPVVDGLSRPGRGTAAVDPVAGSGLLVIRGLTAG